MASGDGFGVDVAKYQGQVDWSALGPLCEVASVKSSEGPTSSRPAEIDPTFVANYRGALDAGVRWVLVNHLPSAAAIPAQIDVIDRALAEAGSTSPAALPARVGIALDVEPDTGAGIPTLDPGFVVELADACAAHYARPLVVGYNGFFQPSWRPLITAGHAWWLPWPYAELGVDGQGRRWFGPDVAALVAAWQTGTAAAGTLPGVAYPCDTDRVLMRAVFDQACGLTDPPPSEEDSAMIVRQAPDGSIWSCVTAPDGKPCLIDTADEGWFVYGVLGYRADGSGPPVPPIDQASVDAARKLTAAQFCAMYPAGSGPAAPPRYRGSIASVPWAIALDPA